MERRRLAALVLLRLVVGLVLVAALGQEQEQCRRLALAVTPLRQAASPLSLLARVRSGAGGSINNDSLSGLFSFSTHDWLVGVITLNR